VRLAPPFAARNGMAADGDRRPAAAVVGQSMGTTCRYCRNV
jgi:hypothetical protein